VTDVTEVKVDGYLLVYLMAFASNVHNSLKSTYSVCSLL